ncbi:MAG: hypothetical protein AAGE03_10355 [Pseudomonadota bacterium]
MFRPIAFIFAFVLIAGCQSVEPSATSDRGPIQPASAAEALAIFDGVCGASLPDFSSAARLMPAFDVTNRQSTGTVFSTTRDLSLKILDGPGEGRTCSMVFSTIDSAAQTRQVFEQLGPFTDGPSGTGTLYRGRNALVLFRPAGGSGASSYYNIRLLSER